MRFLKGNSGLLCALALLPLFFIYIDKPAMLLLRDFHKSALALHSLTERIAPAVNILTHGTTIIALCCALILFGRRFKQELTATGSALLKGFIVSGIAVQVLKHLIGRARPRITEEFLATGPTLKGGFDSLPSGHTAVMFCLAYILAQRFPRYRSIVYLSAFITGLMRTVYMSHFPSDVLAGAVVGLAVGKLLTAAVPSRANANSLGKAYNRKRAKLMQSPAILETYPEVRRRRRKPFGQQEPIYGKEALQNRRR